MRADFIPKGAQVLKLAGLSPTAPPPVVVPMRTQAGQAPPEPQMGGDCPSGLCDTGRIPHGARPIPMAGQRPQMGCACAGVSEAPQPQPRTIRDLEGAESHTHVVRVEGLGEDGQVYTADVEVGFPVPAKVMGVTHSPMR